MNEFKSNKPQLQAALNTIMEITLNAFMKAESNQLLPDSKNNKENGLGLSESLALQIHRDRLGTLNLKY